jgi:hypothetical protein
MSIRGVLRGEFSGFLIFLGALFVLDVFGSLDDELVRKLQRISNL